MKLDIDNTEVELEIVAQIMADPKLTALIDEFYFEYHLWVEFNFGGHQWVSSRLLRGLHPMKRAMIDVKQHNAQCKLSTGVFH